MSDESMRDDIIVRLGRLATAPPTDLVIPRQRYSYLPRTPIDGRRDRQRMSGAELLPVVSEAFELAGLSPSALIVLARPTFLVMSPAGDLVAQLWPVEHRPYWLVIRCGAGFSQKPVAGPLGELAQRIAGWMADSQRVADSRPGRALPPVGGRRVAETEPPVTPEPRPSGTAPTPAAPTAASPTPAPPTPAPPTAAAPAPAPPSAAAPPAFLVTSPTYSLVAELWHDPHRPHWHATRHENGRTQETATGTLGRLAERIAQWAPLRNVRHGD